MSKKCHFMKVNVLAKFLLKFRFLFDEILLRKKNAFLTKKKFKHLRSMLNSSDTTSGIGGPKGPLKIVPAPFRM